MALLRPTPWVSQPQVAADIDLAKAKELGVVYLAVANESGILRDLIGGGTLTNPGGAGVGQGGKTWTFNGSQQGNASFSFPAGAQYPEGVVVCGRIKATAAQAGLPGAAFGYYNSAAQMGLGIGFDASNNVGAAWLSTGGAGLTGYSSGSIGRFYTVFANAFDTVKVSSWVDGVAATTNQGGLISGVFSASPNEIAVGAQHRSSGFLRQFKGEIEWVAILVLPAVSGTVAMNNALAARMYAEKFPYNIFKPIPRRLFVPVSAGSDVTITATLGNADATGYTASVQSAGNVTISCNLGAATAAGSQATVNSAIAISASLGAASAAGYTAALDIAYTLAANLGTASATGNTATIFANESIACTIGTALASGYSATVSSTAQLTDSEKIDLILDILSNKQTIDPVSHTYTLFADDGVTVLKTALAWEDSEGTIPYRGQALQRLDEMQ